MMSVPWLSVLVAVPALGAVVVRLLRDESECRAVATGAALVGAAGALAIAVLVAQDPTLRLVEVGPAIPWLGARWRLGVDGLAAPFLPLAGGLALAVLLAAPRQSLHRDALVALLSMLAATWLAYVAVDLLLFAVAWMASLVPGAVQMRRARSKTIRAHVGRLYDAFLVVGGLPVVAAVLVLGWARTRAGVEPFDGTSPAHLGTSEQHVVFFLFAIAVLVRKAVFPFHSWLPVLIERGPVGIATLLVGGHLGAFLLARVVLPMLPEAARDDLAYVAYLALASAMHATVIALAQRDIRRTIGFVLTAQMGLVLVGLAQREAAGLHGAMLQMLALALTGSGLLLLARGLEVRAGTTDVARFGGVVGRLPTLATGFFLLSVAAIGLPGTLQYVAEDLLLHGLLDEHPIVASVMLVVLVLQGVTLLRMFFAVFLGPAREPRLLGPGVGDLTRREAGVVAVIVGVIVVGGLVPQPLIDVRAPAIAALAPRGLPTEGSQ